MGVYYLICLGPRRNPLGLFISFGFAFCVFWARSFRRKIAATWMDRGPTYSEILWP